MNTLRWILGVIGVLFDGGFLTLFVVSNGFRRSFGASDNNPLLAILPIAAMGFLSAALIWPLNKILLHAGATVAVGLVAFCVWQIISEAATILWFALLYLGFWFVFYGSKVLATPTATGALS